MCSHISVGLPATPAAVCPLPRTSGSMCAALFITAGPLGTLDILLLLDVALLRVPPRQHGGLVAARCRTSRRQLQRRPLVQLSAGASGLTAARVAVIDKDAVATAFTVTAAASTNGAASCSRALSNYI